MGNKSSSIQHNVIQKNIERYIVGHLLVCIILCYPLFILIHESQEYFVGHCWQVLSFKSYISLSQTCYRIHQITKPVKETYFVFKYEDFIILYYYCKHHSTKFH